MLTKKMQAMIVVKTSSRFSQIDTEPALASCSPDMSAGANVPPKKSEVARSFLFFESSCHGNLFPI